MEQFDGGGGRVGQLRGIVPAGARHGQAEAGPDPRPTREEAVMEGLRQPWGTAALRCLGNRRLQGLIDSGGHAHGHYYADGASGVNHP